jgi:hypothetical protein
MKLKLLFSVLALSVASFLYATERESMVAVSADGDKTTYALATVSRINVIADANSASMTVVDKDGNQFAGYVKILLAEKETSIEELGFTQVYVFPNPVVNTLTIQGVDENTPLEVYNLTGKSVLKDKGAELDVTSLSQGTYILRINNQYVKFIKK